MSRNKTTKGPQLFPTREFLFHNCQTHAWRCTLIYQSLLYKKHRCVCILHEHMKWGRNSRNRTTKSKVYKKTYFSTAAAEQAIVFLRGHSLHNLTFATRTRRTEPKPKLGVLRPESWMLGPFATSFPGHFLGTRLLFPGEISSSGTFAWQQKRNVVRKWRSWTHFGFVLLFWR